MDRYKILLGKTPPPPSPQSKEKPKKSEKINKEGIISQYLRTAEGRQRLAASMVNPLRQRLDYSSVARRAFLVEPLPSGALPIYEQLPNNPAFFVDERGENIAQTNRSSERVAVPMFEISSNPSIPLRDIREHRFEAIERAQNFGLNEIRTTENRTAFALLDVATEHQKMIVPQITNSILVDAFSNIEKNDLRVQNIFSTPSDYTIIRQIAREHIEPTNQRELLQSGIMGHLWGAQIIVSRMVPEHEIFVTAEPQFIGRLPIRNDISVLSADDPMNMTLGWMMFETVGMMCNPRGIARISINGQ